MESRYTHSGQRSTPDNPTSQKQELLCSKRKAASQSLCKCGGPGFTPSSQWVELGIWSHVVLNLKTIRRLQNLSSQLRNASEVRHVAWKPRETIVWIREDKAWIALETPSCWGFQSHEISAKESYWQDGSQPKRKKQVAVRKSGHTKSHLISPLTSRIEIQRLEFPGWILVLLYPVSLHYGPFGMVVYILCHCVLELCNRVFDVTGNYSKEIVSSLRRDFGLWTSK